MSIWIFYLCDILKGKETKIMRLPLKNNMCKYACVCVGHVCACEYRLLRDNKTASHPQEPERQAVMRCLIWTLGTQPRSSVGVVCSPNPSAISPSTPSLLFLFLDTEEVFNKMCYTSDQKPVIH